MSSAGNSSGGFQAVSTIPCGVDIYTFENGEYNFDAAAVLSCRVRKGIRDAAGTFDITLAPTAAPNTQNTESWAKVITPMSLVVVAMGRGSHNAVTMIGVVAAVGEKQVWTSGTSVRRTITITGFDMSYFFTLVDYYTLWFLGAQPEVANSTLPYQGLLAGDPGNIGSTWYNTIMALGVLKGTYVPYQGGQVPFVSMMATRFDNYDVTVPYGDYFLGANGPWIEKFRQIFPMPFYEFFVTTASNGVYSGTSGGEPFGSAQFGQDVVATPSIVARLNPVPQLVSSIGGAGLPSFNSIDTTAWNALQTFTLEGIGFIASDVAFSENEIYNFFAINPTWLQGMNGQSNANFIQFIFNYAICLNQASINRYGYRPLMQDTTWLADLEGTFGTGNAGAGVDLPVTVATLLGRLCGYYTATALMASAVVTTQLRPDIQIGNKFTYQPFRDQTNWTFYVEAVQHDYTFGGASTTTLTLGRGLPSAIYADGSSTGLLYNIHIGNAQRVDGEYQIGLPSGSAAPLTALLPTQYNTWMAQIGSYFTSPQATTPTNSH